MTGLLAFLGDHTVRNVVAGASLLGVVSGVLGSFAVLRRQSLLGDTLSHAALPGICLGFMIAGTRDLPSILAGALATAVLAALAMLALTRWSRLKTDAGLGIALSVFFAFGVVLLTHVQGTGAAGQGGLDSFLFGQAAAMLRSDLWIMAGLTGFSVLLVAALWKEFKLVAFDPDFAATLGLPVAVLEAVLTAAIALAVVVGLQMVGVVLMAAMVIAPAVAARQWTTRLGPMVVLAAGFGTASGVAGALVSATARGLATGPLIVLAASALVLVSILLAPGRGVLWEALRRRRDRRALDESQVLATLQALAAHHGDPDYPCEQGMIDTYHGMATRGALSRLRARGLVRAVRHLPHEGRHWALTPEGRERATRLQSGLERGGGGA